MAGTDAAQQAADFLNLTDPPTPALLDDLKQMILDTAAEAPRSLQQALGPSEVGHPCARKLALGLMREPRSNPSGDPLPSLVGTAFHTWLEQAARDTNTRLGRVRWVPETKVEVQSGLAGTCDLYDVDTATVIDWKLPGTSRMAEYRKHGPSEQYRRQAHLYGRGYRRLGLPVEQVGICFLPRGGMLGGRHGAHLWSEPYSDELVDDTLARIDNTLVLIHDLDVETNPDRYQLIPATPTDCTYCPWFTPNPTSPLHCPGSTGPR